MDSPPEPAIELGVQLAAGGGFVLVMTIMHSLGLIGISKLLKLDAKRLLEHEFDLSAVVLLAMLGLTVFSLHMLEIVVFAVFYLVIDAVQTVEESLYFSASAYATLGRTAEYFPSEWRLVGALEALIGFVLIGWTTAFMVNTTRLLTDQKDEGE